MKLFQHHPGWFLASLILGVAQSGLAADPPVAENGGPIFSGTIRAQYPGQNVAMKGIVVPLGQSRDAYVCYDTDLLRVSLGWTGGYLNFGNYMKEINHPQPPQVAGTPVFGTMPGPGWAQGGSFTDPRERQQGPLPKAWAKYRGLYLHGADVVFSYSVGACSVLERPGVEGREGSAIFTRTFQLSKSPEPLTLLVAELENATGGTTPSLPSDIAVLRSGGGTPCVATALRAAPKGAAWEIVHGRVHLKLPALAQSTVFQVAIWNGPEEQLDTAGAGLRRKVELADLASLCQGGPAHWSEPVVTKGVLGVERGPYVVDTITEPVPNPWNAKTFFGGFDFFPDGRAAVCAFHGDVWIVSGIDDKMEKPTWKRFATGLFQPLGLKIVNGQIYVLGRDQITRLHDLNKDDEADFYENFNNDTIATANYHEFCMDLQTDSQGSFYFCKGSPWPPNVDSPHQGAMMKVSRDGSRLDVFATGFRAPNGMTVGPHDEVTVSDNQGHFMPSSKLNLVKKGGYYGMLPAAQRSPSPRDYDQPICWLPMSADNSSGGQTYVTGEQWGPFQDHLLFLSYGRGTLFHVMTEEVDGQTQAGMVRFPFKFGSGVMRARFNPRDGQLYLCGLRGWQTDTLKDGGFYRVRYTGRPVYMPLALHAARNGLRLTFTSPLNETAAVSPQNYSLEQWNYKYSSNYGSEDWSVAHAEAKGHDKIDIQSVALSADKKTVFLEILDLKPSMQMKIKYSLVAADGTPLAQEIYNTIHRLGAEMKLSAK